MRNTVARPRKYTKKLQPQSPLAQWGRTVFVLILAAISLFIYIASAPRMPQLPNPAIKDLAKRHSVEVGVLTYPEHTDSEIFTAILNSQYSFMTIDGHMHWDKIRPSATTYDFSGMDKIVNYASAHELDVQAHHLIWNEDDSLPKWLKEGRYSSAQIEELMHEHITTTVNRYKGRVKEWTVVNEPFTRARHVYGLDNWWGDQFGGGTEYIDKAFRWAHEADPNAKLILNDFNNEIENEVSNVQYDYMKSARERGVPIDGVGIQLHVDASKPFDKQAVIKNMQRFGALGYQVYVTEFDIHISSLKGTSAEKRAIEAHITNDVARACIESRVCVSFTVFGMKDNPSYMGWFNKRQQRAHLLDSRYQLTPLYDAFHEAWSKP